MFTVLIVEDEMLVRLGLKNLMEWERFDMRVIADVANGQAAWEVYEKERPDIIITDLKMPVMDGMELISKIREKDKATRIIILSCVGEFEMAQKAMSMGVSDYILKLSMTEEDIGRVLGKIQQELSLKGSGSKNGEDFDAGHISVLKEGTLKDFLFYNILSAEQFADKAAKYGLRLRPRHMVLCMMEIDRYEGLKARFKDEDGKLIKLSILNVLDEILDKWNRGDIFFDNHRHYVLIFSFHDLSSEQAIRQETFSILNNIKSFFEKYFDNSVTFGISGIKSGFDALEAMYREALAALNKKYFKGTGSLLYPGEEDFKPVIAEKTGSLRNLQEISGLLGESGFHEYQKSIDVFLKGTPETAGQFKEFFYRLMEWILYAIHSRESFLSGHIQPYLLNMQEGDTLEADVACFGLFVEGLQENAGEHKSYSMEITEALRFIRDNYAGELSLKEVADRISLSPGYLSSLFKKELKVNFIEYLNEYRIEKAKVLLTGTYLKSYEISEKVGFSDSTYFSKVFKKITGMGTDEFRKKAHERLDGGM